MENKEFYAYLGFIGFGVGIMILLFNQPLGLACIAAGTIYWLIYAYRDTH